MHTPHIPRFSQRSAPIDMARLERESRRYIYLGLVIGVIVHLAAGQLIRYTGIRSSGSEPTMPSQIAADLVVLPPDVANPYQHWRREPDSRQYVKPDVQPVRPDERVDWQSRLSDPNTPHATVMSDGTVQRMLRELTGREDSLVAGMHAQEAAERYRIDLRIGRYSGTLSFYAEDLLNLDDIDALGTYKALVIRDPSDRQNLRGFFHIPQYFLDMQLHPQRSYNLINAITGLSEAFNFYTGLKLTIDSPLSLLSEEVWAYPVIYLTTESLQAIEIGERQTHILREYFDRGGFAILDSGRPWRPWSPSNASLLQMLAKAFGDSIQFARLPRDHPVYYCFFEFAAMTPQGAEDWAEPVEKHDNYPDWGRLLHDPVLDRLRSQVSASPASLWGVWRGERLVAIYSDKGYGHLWHRGIVANQSRDFHAHSGETYNFNPQLKLGVNMLVYALLQEGGIAMRITDNSLR